MRKPKIEFSGWRSVSLLGLAIFCFSRACVYVPIGGAKRDTPAAILVLTQGSPLTVTGWGCLWALVALVLVVGAHVHQLLPVGLVAFLFITTASAAVYGLSWALLYPPNNGEWSSALLYVGLATAAFGLIRVNARQAELAEALTSLNVGEVEA